MTTKKKKSLKGSATVVVIFASITASIYMVSAFADYQHYNTMLSKYENNINRYYDSRVENVDKYYNEFLETITNDESFILE